MFEVTEEPSARPGDRPASHGDIAVHALDPAAPPKALYTLRLPGEVDQLKGRLNWDGPILWAQSDWGGIWGWRADGGPREPLLGGRLVDCELPRSLIVHEGRAYATCSTGFGGISGTRVYDLSLAPTCPLLAEAPYQQGDFTFIESALAVAQGVLWLGYAAGELRGLDVEASIGPPSLSQVAALRLVGNVRQIVWDEARKRLLSTDGDGLVAIDVDDPDRPLVGRRLAGGSYIETLQVDGDHLALVDGGGADVLRHDLQLRDLRDPDLASIVPIDADAPLPLARRARPPMRLAGSRLLLAGRRYEDRTGDEYLGLWDWPPSGEPREQRRWPIAGMVKSLALQGPFAAVAVGSGRGYQSQVSISVFDATTGTQRDIAVPLAYSYFGWADLGFAGGHLWLATSSSKPSGHVSAVDITRIDTRDPHRLHAARFWRETSSSDWPAEPILVADPSAGHLILGQGTGTVRVFSMERNRLASLTLLQSPAPFEDMDISADGDRIFLASGEQGLVTIHRPPGGWRREPVR